MIPPFLAISIVTVGISMAQQDSFLYFYSIQNYHYLLHKTS